MCSANVAFAQGCPANIDFETGTFANWTCYTGRTSAVGDQNVITLYNSYGPVSTHHTMYGGNTSQLDPFGGFPVLCPNGSGHSIRLGSTEAGGQAEGVSYDFDVPANNNSYSVTFHYAVVFQSPNHRINEQPRMEVEVTNVTDNSVINCGSFAFIAVGSSLPGFEVSNLTDTITVLYKKWSSVTVDLSGNAGKKIRLFFKTADCTFRRHFGYAYIDVDSDCSGSFVGAAFCPGDTVVHVTGPAGYAGYTWYDSALTTVLGKGPTLILKPPPPSGTSIALKLDPYDGYGCQKVLLAYLKDTLKLTADAGKDQLYCHIEGVQIGALPTPALVYKWSPAAGLSNPEISNPIAAPDVTTTYTLTTSSVGDGCKTSDAVVIKSSAVDTSLRLVGKSAFCFGYGDSAILKITPTQQIEWYKDNVAIDATGITSYQVETSGTYYAVLQNSDGCTLSTSKQAILIEQPIPPITYPVKYAIINLPLPLEARNIGNQVLWKPGTWLDNPASYTPNFTSATEQLYAIEMHTAAGCVTVDTQLVKTVKNVEIYVPSGFTPNGDGNNDVLRPVLRGVKNINYFRIFNRAGNLLFETNVERLGWNGIYKGIPQDPQTLVWMLEITGVDGHIFQRKGTTVLLR
jgi:gliding motility-associated-like protein